MDYKTCTKCGETKAVDEFSAVSGTARRRSHCKVCVCRFSAEWHNKTADERHKKKAEYRNKPAVRLSSIQRSKAAIDGLSDSYVRRVLFYSGVPKEPIPQHVIELKRQQLAIRRLSRQLKKGLKNETISNRT